MRLARDQVQSELSLGLKRDWYESGRRAKRADLVERVGTHVAVADEVGQRHLRVVHEPQDGLRRRVVAQDKLASRTQHARDPVEERLRVGVVMEAVRADNNVEAPVVERQVLGVSHDEACPLDALIGRDLDHLGRQAKYGKDAGQIVLRFEVQEGLVVLPKSTRPERIKSNLDIFGFELTDAEMDAIRALDTGKGTHDPDDPVNAERLLSFRVHD